SVPASSGSLAEKKPDEKASEQSKKASEKNSKAEIAEEEPMIEAPEGETGANESGAGESAADEGPTPATANEAPPQGASEAEAAETAGTVASDGTGKDLPTSSATLEGTATPRAREEDIFPEAEADADATARSPESIQVAVPSPSGHSPATRIPRPPANPSRESSGAEPTPSPPAPTSAPTPTPSPTATMPEGLEALLPGPTSGEQAEETVVPTPASTPSAPDRDLQVEAKVKPSRESYPRNRSLTYTVSVTWRGSPEEIAVTFPERLSLANLDASGPARRVAPRSSVGKGRGRTACTYFLEPREEGPANVGALRLNVAMKDGGGVLSGGRFLDELAVGEQSLLIGGPAGSWGKRTAAFFGLLVAAVAGFWGLSIARALIHRKRYSDAIQEAYPSVDERLTGELAAMDLALVRGDVQDFYGKALALLSRLLQGRNLLDEASRDSKKIVESLRAREVDPAFLDCVESILHRCDAVRLRGERPSEVSHAKMTKDLRTVIRMRPHVASRQSQVAGKKRQKAPADQS
ncbi:MAG TPA: hypothetical protein VM492_08645, partial [Sumerlaeia bacterium]|nr:hypothetical protein [Sumerlaeia bacterium]